MAKDLIEDCFPLSLDALPAPSVATQVRIFDVRVEIDEGGSRESRDYKLLVKRRENRLTVILQRVGSRYHSLRQIVTIYSYRAGGYREFMLCPRCGGRFRWLFFPWGDFYFLCRFCHGLAYKSQSRDRNALERIIVRRKTFGLRRPKPLRKEALEALLAAARSPDPAAMDAFACRPGRPPKGRVSSKRKRGRSKTKRKYQRAAYDRQKCGPDQAYCVKCKVAREIVNAVRTEFGNGRPAIAGVCAICGTKVHRATKREELSAN